MVFKIISKQTSSLLKLTLLCMVLLLLSTATVQADDNADPLEGFNRAMFSFNEVVDRFLFKPAAKGYHFVTPQFVDDGITNFFGNLGEVKVIVNDILQFKFTDAVSDTGRFIVNTTVGVAGFIDVATRIGLEKHQEDFGQTLGSWGIGSGPYIVLPLLGPTTLRDGIGRVPDSFLNPVRYVNDDWVRYGLYALEVVDFRADLLAQEKQIFGDRYTFIRDVYLQRRDFLVNDGEVDDEFTNDFE